MNGSRQCSKGVRPPHGPAERRCGAVMLEFVMAFPVVLVLVLACVQFAHLLVAKQVVHYAAFCAARAALVTVCDVRGPGDAVHNDSWPRPGQLIYAGLASGKANTEAEWAACKAAARVCDTIMISAGGETVEQKTRASVVDSSPVNVEATVEHDFALVVPVVGPMLAWAMNPWDLQAPWSVKSQDETGDRWLPFPHLRLRETVALPKPYRTVIAAGRWSQTGGW